MKLCISPCPNDTFMFDALINGRIDTGGVRFETEFADIERLNAMAQAGLPDVCKVSYAVWPLIRRDYALLNSGSALGRGNGPLLVSGREINVWAPGKELGLDDHASDSRFRATCRASGAQLRELYGAAGNQLRVAIPGVHTTANLLMNRLFNAITNKTPVLFSQIAERVAAGEFDAGVLIHEGRFTYAAQGLHLCADLGAEWERREGVPLPLGAIVVRRALGDDVRKQVETLVRRSVQHAMSRPNDSRDFVRRHAREMDAAVIASHIALFVNDFSLNLGTEGRQAVERLVGRVVG